VCRKWWSVPDFAPTNDIPTLILNLERIVEKLSKDV
jgi:hypothetical protein